MQKKQNLQLVLWRTFNNRERDSYRGTLFNAMRRATSHTDSTGVRRRQSNTPFQFLQNDSIFYRFSDRNFVLISPSDNTLRIRSAIIRKAASVSIWLNITIWSRKHTSQWSTSTPMTRVIQRQRCSTVVRNFTHFTDRFRTLQLTVGKIGRTSFTPQNQTVHTDSAPRLCVV